MTTPPNTRLPLRRALGKALDGALQWRLWLLWIAATLLCTLIAALPVWTWLAAQLNYSVHASEIASGNAPTMLLEAALARHAPLRLLAGNMLLGGALMLLLSPWLAAAAATASRAPARLGFGDLVRGGLAEYGPMLRMLLWSAIPLGLALLVMSLILNGNEKAHEHAVVASEEDFGRNLGLFVGAVLFVVAHAGIEAGRGWLAADSRLRSALKAWWRGIMLLRRRPFAVFGMYLVPTVLALCAAAPLLLLRPLVDGASVAGFVAAWLLTCAVTAALAWGRIARLLGMKALAEDMHARR